MRKLGIAIVVIMLAIILIGGQTSCTKVDQFDIVTGSDEGSPTLALVLEVENFPRIKVPIPVDKIVELANAQIDKYSSGKLGKYVEDVVITMDTVLDKMVIKIEAKLILGTTKINVSKEFNFTEIIGKVLDATRKPIVVGDTDEG